MLFEMMRNHRRSPMPRMLTSRSAAVALALLLCAASASAQVIIVGPAAASSVPANGPMALALLMGALALAGWWQLRRGPAAQRVLGWLAVVTLGVALHHTGLLAVPANSFTNPAGQTLPIPVAPIVGTDFTGFAQEAFTNNSGATLRVTGLTLPTLAQCFTGANTADKLLQPGTPSNSATPLCQVSAVLANGDACRVDVDAICRGLLGTAPTFTALSPNNGPAAGGTLVTLTGSGFTGATSVSFGGAPGTSVTVVNDGQITAVTPAGANGAVDVTVSTPAGMVRLAGGFTYAYAVGQPLAGGKIATLPGGQPVLIVANADIAGQLDWGDANTACTSLNSGGYTDWYLPDANQLNSFMSDPAIGGFTSSAYYWTSTYFGGTTAEAVNFDGSSFNWTTFITGTLLNVRCVRNY
jgi:hypothetical protein